MAMFFVLGATAPNFFMRINQRTQRVARIRHDIDHYIDHYIVPGWAGCGCRLCARP